MLHLLHKVISDTSLRRAAMACGVNRNSVRWWLSHGLPDVYGKHYAQQLAKLCYPHDASMRRIMFKKLLEESAEFRHRDPAELWVVAEAPKGNEDENQVIRVVNE